MAKRANGEGNIRRRPDGTWEARITIAGNRKSLYGKTQAEVRQKMRNLQKANEACLDLAASEMTIAEWLSIWMRDYRNSIKHIFCEKPMAMTVEECDAMIEACDRNHVKLQIGFMRRFDASFREAKRLVDSGAIGDLVQIHSNTRGPSKPRPWMYDIKKSNGILAEVNSHDIDAVRWMAGSDIDTLYAVAGNFRNPEAKEEYPDYYDSVLMSGTMKNGVHFCIDGAAYVQYGYDSKMELVGTKGKINVGRSDKEFVHCTTVESGTNTPFINSWMTLFIDAYLAEDTSFVNAVLNDTPVEVSGYDGRMAVATVQAGNLSIAEKNIQTVK